MPKLPRPRSPLAVPVAGDIYSLRRGTLLWRCYRHGGSHPTRWDVLRDYGPTSAGRFDHHLPPPQRQARAISYLALEVKVALAEFFQVSRTINRTRNDPWLAGFTVAADITLLDLRGDWPTRAGASQAISSGRRPTAQLWSRAIYDEFPSIAGLIYPSSMVGGGINLAVYDRGRSIFPAGPAFHGPLDHPGLAMPLIRVAAEVGYGFV